MVLGGACSMGHADIGCGPCSAAMSLMVACAAKMPKHMCEFMSEHMSEHISEHMSKYMFILRVNTV